MTVLLAKPWEGQDPTGWWMSEKLDGVRAIWRDGAFYSRNGNAFHAPDWFRAQMPSVALDGELFVGRGRFDETVSIVRSHSGERWDQVTYQVFDLYPETPEDAALTFEQRVSTLQLALPTRHCARLIHIPCVGVAHLTACVDHIVGNGGEGVMLRAPGSLYEKKRSSTLLKVKRFHDAEATVTGHVAGKGKHLGRLGALDCVTDEGVAFQLGTGLSDAQREAPPTIGTRVTFRFQELTKDRVPRFPVFVAARDYE